MASIMSMLQHCWATQPTATCTCRGDCGCPSHSDAEEVDDGPRLGRGMRDRTKPDHLLGATLNQPCRDAHLLLAAARHMAAATLFPPACS